MSVAIGISDDGSGSANELISTNRVSETWPSPAASDASVLGFPRMVRPILQVPGDCCLYRFDQPAARRVAEALISFQGEIDIFGEAFDEMMRLGERCPALEDDCLDVVGFVEAL